MNESERVARALAQRAYRAADLSEAELEIFGSWLLDTMSRLMMVHDDQIVAMHLRSMAHDAFNYGQLSQPEQRALGGWVTCELDDLRGLDRRSPLNADRRATRASRDSLFETCVATLEQAGFDWALSRQQNGYGAVVAPAPAHNLTHRLATEHASHGATALDALRTAMRRAEAASAAH